MTSIQYLTENNQLFIMELLSDAIYLTYFVMVLFAVKYKIKILLILAIIVLIVCEGLKVNILVTGSMDNGKIDLIYTI